MSKKGNLLQGIATLLASYKLGDLEIAKDFASLPFM